MSLSREESIDDDILDEVSEYVCFSFDCGNDDEAEIEGGSLCKLCPRGDLTIEGDIALLATPPGSVLWLLVLLVLPAAVVATL